ncbi:MAG: peptigoglycan-binding protein LysM, partial [Pseudomonadota bacterium]|nr:peptigoglycan-binding protein LysM [Pseudomonadota bacterium]
MMTRTFASVAVMAALGLLAPMQVSAFGLGKLELSSALNEPFKAEIAITALKGDDADNLQVRLASSKEFEQAGIERNFLLTQLKFDVVEKSGNVKIV